MQLSSRLISLLLRQHFTVQESENLSTDPCLKYPVFYQADRSIRPGLIYLVDNPEFIVYDLSLSKVMFILVGKGYDPSLMKHHNVCQVLNDTSCALVFQILQEIFDVYNEWNQNLLQTLSASPTVQQLLELSEPAIQNPMSVVSMNFQVLGSIRSPSKDTVTSFGTSEATRPIVNSLKYDKNYENAVNYTQVFYYPGNNFAGPSLCYNIRIQNKTEFRLLIHPGIMPLDDSIGFLVEFLGKNITNLLISSVQEDLIPSRSRRNIFEQLLSDPKSDYVLNSQRLSETGWEVSHYYQCIVILPGEQDYKNHTLQSVCRYIESNFNESCTIIHRGKIVIYINLTLSSASLEDIQRRLAFYIRDSYFRAGYSRKMLGHFNFYRQYQQAKLTLELGERLYPTRWVQHFNDVALYYLLDQTRQKLPVYMIAHEQLLALKYQDENGDSDYYETLHQYLLNNQSPTKTAQALYIHRSTLLYRLEHIKKVLHSDLNDPDENLYLLLSYKLNEIEK